MIDCPTPLHVFFGSNFNWGCLIQYFKVPNVERSWFSIYCNFKKSIDWDLWKVTFYRYFLYCLTSLPLIDEFWRHKRVRRTEIELQAVLLKKKFIVLYYLKQGWKIVNGRDLKKRTRAKVLVGYYHWIFMMQDNI